MSSDEKIVISKDLQKDIYFSEKGFLFDGTTGLTYSLNPTGGFIFHRFREGHKLSDILAMMIEEYDVNEERAEMDLKCFIRQLNEFKII